MPDAEPRIFNNRIYIYGSHDLFNGKIFVLGIMLLIHVLLMIYLIGYEKIIYKKEQNLLNKKKKQCMCLIVFKELMALLSLL